MPACSQYLCSRYLSMSSLDNQSVSQMLKWVQDRVYRQFCCLNEPNCGCGVTLPTHYIHLSWSRWTNLLSQLTDYYIGRIWRWNQSAADCRGKWETACSGKKRFYRRKSWALDLSHHSFTHFTVHTLYSDRSVRLGGGGILAMMVDRPIWRNSYTYTHLL